MGGGGGGSFIFFLIPFKSHFETQNCFNLSSPTSISFFSRQSSNFCSTNIFNFHFVLGRQIYRMRSQSTFLSSIAKGAYLFLRDNCAYIVPIPKLHDLFHQAAIFACRPVRRKPEDGFYHSRWDQRQSEDLDQVEAARNVANDKQYVDGFVSGNSTTSIVSPLGVLVEDMPVKQFGEAYKSSDPFCNTDVMGRRSCRICACFNQDGNFILPGREDGAVVQQSVEDAKRGDMGTSIVDADFVLPIGFHWLTFANFNDDPAVVGVTVPEAIMEKLYSWPEGDGQRAPILLISFPERHCRNHFDFLQYSAGTFSARLRYNVRIGESWHFIVLHDPFGWVTFSAWTEQMWDLITGQVPTTVVSKERLHSACFRDVVFHGWSETPFSGWRDMFYWRRYIRWAYPRVPLQGHKFVLIGASGEDDYLVEENPKCF